MATYRVMDSDGVIVDKAHEPSDVPDEEVLTWYKNMLTGKASECWHLR
jgi:2-oxoisovalerate dehydrogenase E1 component alpha subunit